MDRKHAEVKGASLTEVGEQLMEFYINTIIEAKLPEIRKQVVAANPQADPDYIGTLVTQAVYKNVPEMVYKFNQILMMLIDYAACGQEPLLRDFEAKFEDLMERTLLRHTEFNTHLAAFRQMITDLVNRHGGDSDINDTIGNA